MKRDIEDQLRRAEALARSGEAAALGMAEGTGDPADLAVLFDWIADAVEQIREAHGRGAQ